jgi:biotin carboxylase
MTVSFKEIVYMHIKRILLLVPTTTYRLDDFLQAATRLNIDVILASNRCHVLAEQWPDHLGLSLPFSSPHEAVEKAFAALRGKRIDAVIAADDHTTILAAMLAEKLGLPGSSLAAAEKTRNKLSLRRALAAGGMLSPKFLVAKIAEPPESYLPQIEFPVVLKPLLLSGSRGVIRANNPQEFIAAFHRIAALLRNREFFQMRSAAAKRILIESYIPGSEVAVEGLLTRGKLSVLAIFDKPDPLEGPFFEETIYVTPSRLPRETQRAIYIAVARACQILGLQHGPIHAEARLNEQGVFIIEIAARTIGGLCSRTLKFGTGLSLEELVLRHATGEEINGEALLAGASGVMMLPIPCSGRLHAVSGMEEALAVPNIQEVKITIPIDNLVIALPEGASYLGFMFARAETPQEVEASLRAAHAKLHFDIQPALAVREE